MNGPKSCRGCHVMSSRFIKRSPVKTIRRKVREHASLNNNPCPTTVYGISCISQPDLRAVNFAKAIAGYKLNGNRIKEIEVDSERSCQVACVIFTTLTCP